MDGVGESENIIHRRGPVQMQLIRRWDVSELVDDESRLLIEEIRLICQISNPMIISSKNRSNAIEMWSMQDDEFRMVATSGEDVVQLEEVRTDQDVFAPFVRERQLISIQHDCQ